MRFMSEDDAKYFKEKNDETYINQEDIGDVTMLDEKEEVDDEDVMLGGGMESASLFRIKIANFLDSIKARLLGNTDISSVGDGTVTGAISENAENISANKEETDSAIDELNSALAENIVVEKVSQDNISVSANDISSNITISTSKSGYTPLCCGAPMLENGSTNGTLSSRCTVYNVQLNNAGNVSAIIYNVASSTNAVVKLTVPVIYRKNS